MELNHLRYFYEVAKAGSFTEAARKLRISQSALSKAVALLEGAEGVKLFERSKKGVTMTHVGQDVFRMSTAIFRTVSEIEDTCRGTKEICEGYLRFGASDHVTNYLLTRKLKQMRAEHPKVIPSVFSGTPNEIIGLILNHELEFGLFFTRVNVPGISYDTVMPVSMAVVCHPKFAPDLKTDVKGGLPIAKLRKVVESAGFIGSIKSQYQHHPSEGFMALLNKDTETSFESNSQEAQKRFCVEGGGVAYLARFMVEKELAEGKLVELPTREPFQLELQVARSKSVPLSLSARTLLAMIGKD